MRTLSVLRRPPAPILAIALALTAATLGGCKGKEGGDAPAAASSGAAAATTPATVAAPKLEFPGTPEGAKALLVQLLTQEAQDSNLSAALRPTTADYAAVFEGEAAAKAEAEYKAPWDAGAMQVKPGRPAQTEIKLFSATTEQLRAGEGEAGQFPGGYKGIADQLKPGLTWYRFKFTEPGSDLGMAYDGLVHVNGHWRIFPKPFRALGK